MVAPVFDFAADGGRGVVRGRTRRRRAAAAAVEGAGEGFRAARRGGEPFLHLAPVDLQIGEKRVAEPPADRLRAAAGLGQAQRAGVEVEAFGEADEERGGDGTLVALDQVEVAGRHRQRLGHRRLGQSRPAAQTAHRVSGHQLAFGHLDTLNTTSDDGLSRNRQNDKNRRAIRDPLTRPSLVFDVDRLVLSIIALSMPNAQAFGSTGDR